MDLKISGKYALVMGASAGIGRGIAESMIQEGMNVIVASRNEAVLHSVASEIGAKAAIPVDLNQSGSGRRLVQSVLDRFGRLDVLVCNTGGPPKGDFQEVNEGQWQQAFQGLWLSTVDAIQTSLPSMKAQKWGRVLLITSVAAKEAMPHLTISNGLRAGLLGLMRSLSHEVAADGVTINSILPGFTDTERLRELGIPKERITEQVPMRRLGSVEELASLATYLASDHAAYITGQAIACDGGYLRSI